MIPDAWWSETAEALSAALGSGPRGLDDDAARARLAEVGPNRVARDGPPSALRAFLAQLSNPLAWLLLFAMGVSSLAGEWTDAVVVGGILLLGATLSFVQERRATNAVLALRGRVAVRAEVVRGGERRVIPVEDVVPGDVLVLSAGGLVAADAVVLEAKDFFVSESALTGETFPTEKRPGVSPADAALPARANCVFLGTSVRSGTARALVVRTGARTLFGAISRRLALRPPEPEFERGLRRFGQMLTRVMFVLVLCSTALNLLAHKPPIDSLLFAIALAVGLAPEMLPAIVAVTLSRGAVRMASAGVIVRRLGAIEGLGSMDVFCTDKTGTLTEGTVRLDLALDPSGAPSERVLGLAWINATLQTGLANPLDDAIAAAGQAAGPEVARPRAKLDEIPYDFVRKRLSVVVDEGGEALLVTKGALATVLDVCVRVRVGGDARPLDEEALAAVRGRAEALARDGIRVLGVATRVVGPSAERRTFGHADERELVLEGLLGFADPPKPGVAQVLRELRELGVEVKIVTGDASAVARHVAEAVGLPVERVVTGSELLQTRDEALWHLAERASIFAEVDPNQKERIILALRKTGHVVGYMGDGINDAPALHAADLGISVEGATDVARDAADFVLLRQDLEVLHAGVLEGRRTFANTLKYLYTTESANFGNMLSMAASAAFLPFLPLLASQVLLNNFLSDVPALAIAGDAVDPEHVARPRRWDTALLRRFMITFGAVSTVFDLLTFAGLYGLARATEAEFRSGWFLESLLTEVLVAFVVRTERPFWRSRPAPALLALSLAVAAVAIALPYTPIGPLVELQPPPRLLALVLGVTMAYVTAVELVKRALLARMRGRAERTPRGSAMLWR